MTLDHFPLDLLLGTRPRKEATMTESVLKADEGEGMHEYRNPPPHLARAYKKQTTPPLSPSLPSHPSRARRVNGRQLSAVIGEFKTATPH